MCEHDHLPELPLPDLCDDCAIAILDFFYELLIVYESRYGDQIRNYYDDRSDRSDHNPNKPDLNPLDEDPPF